MGGKKVKTLQKGKTYEGKVESIDASGTSGWIKAWRGRAVFDQNSLAGGTRRPRKGEYVQFRAIQDKDGRWLASDVVLTDKEPKGPGLPQQPAPYTFVPVVISRDNAANRLFKPVTHEGSSRQDLYSGEVRCTLQALTPLLVGQRRYSAEQIEGTVQEADVQIGKERKTCILLPEEWGPVGEGDEQRYVEPGKGILEPLLIPWSPGVGLDSKRVAIPGHSLKGMLRHNLGAMLGAPMERVAERYFSYRPNLGWAEGDLRYECREAVVLPGSSERCLRVRLLPAKCQNVWFVQQFPLSP